jgi:Domain of unknown function (DUF397)
MNGASGIGGSVDDRGDNRLRWHKSTRSADSSCVEVAIEGEEVRVRDSWSRGPELVFTAKDWTRFVRGLPQVSR